MILILKSIIEISDWIDIKFNSKTNVADYFNDPDAQ